MQELKLNKEKWTRVLLGDIIYEPKETAKDIIKAGFEHIVGLEHIDSEDIHLKNSFTNDTDTTFTKVFRKGDVLFGRRRAYLKKAAQANFDGVCSGDITVLRANHHLDENLLPFLIQNEKFFDYAIKHSAGGLSPRVKFKDLANYGFLLPPKEQQAELAELLWAMDEVIEKDLVVLGKLEKLVKSKRNSMVNSGVQIPLREILILNYGKALKDSERIKGDFSVVSSSVIQGTHNPSMVVGPGIVIGRKGNAGEIIWVNDDFWVIDTAYYAVINEEYKSYPLKGIYHLLKSIDFKKDVTATAVPGLNRDDALNRFIHIPSKIEMVEFTSQIEIIETTINESQSKIQSSKAFQKSLINQLF